MAEGSSAKYPRLDNNYTTEVNGYEKGCVPHGSLYGLEDTINMRHKLIGGATQIHYPKMPLKIVSAKGQYMYDENGNEFLDCINNVAHVGHGHPHVVNAGQKQMAILNTNSRFLHDELVKLMNRLTKKMPPKLTRCYLVCTGTEANDLALRLARTYTKKKDVLVLDRAYHGHSVAVYAISPYKFNQPGGGGKEDHIHVCACPDTYRGLHRNEDCHDAAEEYLKDLKKVYQSANENGRQIGAFFAESLQSCGGQIIYPPGYLKRAFEYVRSQGGVCVADEVQVGFGRVGETFWAFQLHDVEPDIVTIGKPMGNGHPVAAVITTEEISKAFSDCGVPYFNTYGGNPVSCTIANAVLDVIENEHLQEKALEHGNYWKAELLKLKEKHSIIGDVRGTGLFIGIELVKNRETRTPATAEAVAVTYKLREQFILLSADGMDNNVLKIKPPLVIQKKDINHFIRSLDQVLSDITS